MVYVQLLTLKAKGTNRKAAGFWRLSLLISCNMQPLEDGADFSPVHLLSLQSWSGWMPHEMSNPSVDRGPKRLLVLHYLWYWKQGEQSF
eukprot:gene4026-14105_t